MKILEWILGELWEKINFPKVWRELKELGRKHGKRFFWAALIWEIIEDVVFPFISWKMGVPELIPVFLVLHFEPIVYPAFFWGFRMWDRFQGKEPWEPARERSSSYWRSILKGLTFQLSITGWLSNVISWKPLVIYTILQSLFGFVHERIWHDTNYGILATDTVQARRSFAKTGTYLLVSSFTLFPLLRVSGSDSILRQMVLAQLVTGVLYAVLEMVWMKSQWGVRNIVQRSDEQS